DLLRGIWTRNPGTLRAGIPTLLLFGIVEHSQIQDLLSGKVMSGLGLDGPLSPLRFKHSGLELPNMSPLALFWPDWASGRVEYVSRIDFQRAIWLLFRESWRAKVCPKCSTYFLAQKPAQLYCSVSCSSAVHRASSLNWWKETGAQTRAASRKAKQR